MATASSSPPAGRPAGGDVGGDVDAYGPQGRSPWLDVDWRRHQRWVEVAGDLVNVIELGAGDPIVFVHGLSGSWPNWLEQLPVFARTYRVIAFDLPGFGHSPMPARKISIAGYARLVDALLDVLRVPRAVVVGNSMGGFIGAELAIESPARVERLVLVSAAGLTVEHQRDDRVLAVLRRLERRLAAWGGWLGSRADSVVRRPRYRRALMRIVVEHPERLPPPLLAEQLRGSGKPGFVDALDALTDYPLRDRLPRIRCPTLIVWGTEDRLVPVRDAYEFERLIPDSRRVVYADTGHLAMLERPAAFNALLRDFMAEEHGGPPADSGDVPGPEV
ncbi:MAG TPA: alpha/beta hydrolase [Solirubrobacteraceae bacterium]|nr:alpha/beta hydrolase [Solirubrobacteraceae bacterium]